MSEWNVLCFRLYARKISMDKFSTCTFIFLFLRSSHCPHVGKVEKEISTCLLQFFVLYSLSKLLVFWWHGVFCLWHTWNAIIMWLRVRQATGLGIQTLFIFSFHDDFVLKILIWGRNLINWNKCYWAHVAVAWCRLGFGHCALDGTDGINSWLFIIQWDISVNTLIREVMSTIDDALYKWHVPVHTHRKTYFYALIRGFAKIRGFFSLKVCSQWEKSHHR